MQDSERGLIHQGLTDISSGEVDHLKLPGFQLVHSEFKISPGNQGRSFSHFTQINIRFTVNRLSFHPGVQPEKSLGNTIFSII